MLHGVLNTCSFHFDLFTICSIAFARFVQFASCIVTPIFAVCIDGSQQSEEGERVNEGDNWTS